MEDEVNIRANDLTPDLEWYKMKCAQYQSDIEDLVLELHAREAEIKDLKNQLDIA